MLTEWHTTGLTAYTDSLIPCLVCVPCGTLSTLPFARSPHSHQMLLCVVVGSTSCGQVSIIQPHGAVGAKTGSRGGGSIPVGHLPGLCIGWWLFGSESSSILQHPRCIPSICVAWLEPNKVESNVVFLPRSGVYSFWRCVNLLVTYK